MLKKGQVFESLSKNGVVYVEDVYEDRAVRLVRAGKDIEAYIKKKGVNEIVSKFSCDMVQETIDELHNREMTLEEYNRY